MPTLPITVINDKHVRGFLAPASAVSNELLDDLIEMVELSRPEAIKKTQRRIKEADRKHSWISSKEVERRLAARLKTRQ